MIHVTFVMEQQVGHRTYYQNLRKFIDAAPEVAATWVPVTYENGGAYWSNWSFLPQRVRGPLNGRLQVREGLRRRPADVLFFYTQVAAAIAGGDVIRQARQRPYLLCTDITPIQYDKMGAYYGHKADGKGPISQYKHRLNVKLLNNAARLLPFSTWTRDSLVHDYGVPPECIEVNPPGVDLERWRAEARVPGGPMHILFVGGDYDRKGGDVLYKAFHRLPPGTAELHLVTRIQLEPEAHVTVYNDMQPNSPELIALYQAADVFVLPTRADAFGHVAVEASAAGLPVVATAVGGLSDIVVDGETGFLVDPGNVGALVERLQRLAVRPELRQRLGQAARRRAEQRFDARRHAARVLDILQETAVKREQ